MKHVFLQPVCSQGWPGYGNVLFLSFGRKVFPPYIPGIGLKNQKQPANQFQTNMSYWWVQNDLATADKGKDIGFSDLSRESALAAIAALIGKRAIDFEIFDKYALKLQFTGDLSLCVKPDTVNVEPYSCIWGVWEADGYHSWVTHCGQMYRIHKNEPASNYQDILEKDARERMSAIGSE